MKIGKKLKMAGICALFFMSFSGCKMVGAEVVVNADHAENEVFKIRDAVCTLPQARVVLTNYQNIYDTMYGIDLWKHGFKDQELENYVKDLTVSRLAQIMAMNYLAQENEIVLTEEEQTKIKEAAGEYYGSLNDAEKEYMQVKQGDIETLYTRYGLANKLYTFLTQGVNDEVSDEDARVMEAEQISSRWPTVTMKMQKRKCFSARTAWNRRWRRLYFHWRMMRSAKRLRRQMDIILLSVLIIMIRRRQMIISP